MRYSEVSLRYATALFDLSKEANAIDASFASLRAIENLLEKEREFTEFVKSPLIRAEDKESSFRAALENSGVSDIVTTFVLLLAKKNRLMLFKDIVLAFQAKTDEAHGVTRGLVTSPSVLSTEECAAIEKFVSEATKKKVILKYLEDENLVGGTVAQVGSFTFDDTIKSHLRRLKEELKRSAH